MEEPLLNPETLEERAQRGWVRNEASPLARGPLAPVGHVTCELRSDRSPQS